MKEKIRSEVKKLLDEVEEKNRYGFSDWDNGKEDAYQTVLNLIDSISMSDQEESWIERELSNTYITIFDKKFPNLPELKGQKLNDFKNFLNTCQQIFGLTEFGIHPTQAILFKKLALLWATWGKDNL